MNTTVRIRMLAFATSGTVPAAVAAGVGVIRPPHQGKLVSDALARPDAPVYRIATSDPCCHSSRGVDTVTATGSAPGCCLNININAQSGTSGENPSGTVFLDATSPVGP
jgi:hypothetical protein